LNEFALIDRYFESRARRDGGVVIGIGDDAAVCAVPAGQQLVVTTDVLVENVHFPADTAAADIGYKALAVNLSDLAAMGSSPAWFTLTLSLPEVNETWLEGFSTGLFDAAGQFDIRLVGGDTVRGPLVVGIQALGLVPENRALTRAGARAGDLVFVTGHLGDAAMALAALNGSITPSPSARAEFMTRLNRPVPRIPQGQQLLDIATAAIDVSDGLVADLGHIAVRSSLGAVIERDRVPLSTAYRAAMNSLGDTSGWLPALTGGDDYELCFTVPPDRVEELGRIARRWDCDMTQVGEMCAGSGVAVLGPDGKPLTLTAAGHDHFSPQDR
jgi:thiamine-monophosphate kinase